MFEILFTQLTQFFMQASQQIFRHFHEMIKVSKRHIRLADGELGIVSCIDALVAKGWSNFVDLTQATNNQSLQP